MKKRHLLNKLVARSSKKKQEVPVPRTWIGKSVEHAVYKAIYDVLADFLDHIDVEIKMIADDITGIEKATKDIAQNNKPQGVNNGRYCGLDINTLNNELVVLKNRLDSRIDMRKGTATNQLIAKKKLDNVKVKDSLWSETDDDFKIEVKETSSISKQHTQENPESAN